MAKITLVTTTIDEAIEVELIAIPNAGDSVMTPGGGCYTISSKIVGPTGVVCFTAKEKDDTWRQVVRDWLKEIAEFKQQIKDSNLDLGMLRQILEKQADTMYKLTFMFEEFMMRK